MRNILNKKSGSPTSGNKAALKGESPVFPSSYRDPAHITHQTQVVRRWHRPVNEPPTRGFLLMPTVRWFLTFVRMTCALLLLTGCTTPPEPASTAPPLTIHELKTTLVSTAQQCSTLEARTAQLSNDQTLLTGTDITAQLNATNTPTITLTAPHAEWHTSSEQLTATGEVTAQHDAGWLRARGATCDTRRQTIFLKGPVESVLSLS